MKSHGVLKGYCQQCAKGRNSEKGKERKGMKKRVEIQPQIEEERETVSQSFSTFGFHLKWIHAVSAQSFDKRPISRGEGERNPPSINAPHSITRARTSFVRNGSRVADDTAQCNEVMIKHTRLNVHVCVRRTLVP